MLIAKGVQLFPSKWYEVWSSYATQTSVGEAPDTALPTTPDTAVHEVPSHASIAVWLTPQALVGDAAHTDSRKLVVAVEVQAAPS